jgi:hypothetical protein
MKKFFVSLCASSAFFLAGSSCFAALTWNTAVNTTSTTTNQLRSVAASDQAGNDSVYIGYIQTSGNRRLERRDSNPAYGLLNFFASGADQPKGIVTDDRGNVFVSNRGSGTTSSVIRAFSSTLVSGSATTATMPVIGGLAIQKVGPTYYAYAVYEENGLVQRYDVTNPAAMTLDTTFGTLGSYNIPSAGGLRGVEVGSDGTLFVAARDDNKVYRVSSDLATVTSFNLTRAMDVALYGGNLYATSYNGTSSLIQVVDQTTLAAVETINITTLDGNPYSRASSEGWGGIDIDGTGRIWLADQHYGSTGGTQDRLLVSSPVPEPSSIVLAGALLVGFVATMSRRK